MRSILAIPCVMLGMVYPVCALWANPEPAPDHLKRAQIQVVAVGSESPNLTARRSDGTTLEFDLPPTLYTFKTGFLGNDLLKKKGDQLIGCTGRVDYDDMRYMPLKPTRRIWALDCGPVQLPLAAIEDDHAARLASVIWLERFLVVLGVALCGLVWWGDGRRIARYGAAAPGA